MNEKVTELFKNKLICTSAVTATALLFSIPVNAVALNVSEYGGANITETSINVLKANYHNSNVAYIVSAATPVDAFSIGAVAKGPVLAIPSQSSGQQAVASELKRLGVKKAFILGGEGAVNSSSADAVKSVVPSVERVWGKDRYETSLRVAEKFGEGGKIYLADGSGSGGIDSVSASTMDDGIVVLFPQNSSEQASKVATLANSGGYSGIVDVGSVNSGVAQSTIRGKDRYETSFMLADRQNCSEGVKFVGGTAVKDGLVAAGVPGCTVLAPPISNSSTDRISGVVSRANGRISFIGGHGAIPQNVRDNVRLLASVPDNIYRVPSKDRITGTGNGTIPAMSREMLPVYYDSGQSASMLDSPKYDNLRNEAIFKYHNQIRREHGLPEFQRWNNGSVPQSWAIHLANQRRLEHSKTYMNSVRTGWSIGAENVSGGYHNVSPDDYGFLVSQRFLGSIDHKQNLLNPRLKYMSVGTTCVDSNNNASDWCYTVVDFFG